MRRRQYQLTRNYSIWSASCWFRDCSFSSVCCSFSSSLCGPGFFFWRTNGYRNCDNSNFISESCQASEQRLQFIEQNKEKQFFLLTRSHEDVILNPYLPDHRLSWLRNPSLFFWRSKISKITSPLNYYIFSTMRFWNNLFICPENSDLTIVN